MTRDHDCPNCGFQLPPRLAAFAPAVPVAECTCEAHPVDPTCPKHGWAPVVPIDYAAGSFTSDAPPAESAPPVTPEMPVIQQGDVVLYMDTREWAKERGPVFCLHLHRRDGGEPAPALDKVIAIYRTPLWLRPGVTHE